MTDRDEAAASELAQDWGFDSHQERAVLVVLRQARREGESAVARLKELLAERNGENERIRQKARDALERANRLALELDRANRDLSDCAASYEMYGNPEDLSEKNQRLAALVNELGPILKAWSDRRNGVYTFYLENTQRINDAVAKVEAARREGVL